MPSQPETTPRLPASGHTKAISDPGRRPWQSAAAAFGLVLLVQAVFLPQAIAVINPSFTPRDLVKDAAQVWVLRISKVQGRAVAADVVETLKGQGPAARQLSLRLGEDLGEEGVSSAMGDTKAATAILFLQDKADKTAGDEPDGALQIETSWFAVSRQGEKLVLGKDERQLFAVWAGSARMLAAAVRYAQREPAAEFPVRSSTQWGESLKLGTLASPASGCLVADLGKPTGLCAIVLCPRGDRIYRAGSKEAKPTDVTAQVKLGTASKAAAVGDFDEDGRVDLISWDGRSLNLAAQTAEGMFASPRQCAQLPECLSLDCLDVGGPRPALVAGTSQGPVLLVWDASGTLKPQALAAAPEKEALAKLGPGGLCVVADLNGNGRCDVMAVFAKGILFYAGEGTGRFKAPELVALPLVDRPRAAICGDFDADGLLDVIVAGKDGFALLSRESQDRWSNVTHLTGELAYHGNANRPQITACAPCDVNTDGRQGMALFYTDRKPLLFFNRGFACFGWARDLDLDPSAAAADAGSAADPLNEPQPAGGGGPEDLKHGQAAGVVVDLNGDGIPDMLAIGVRDREVWTVFGRRQQGPSRRTCTLVLPPTARGPVTVTVRDDSRIAGMYVVRPGIPAFVGRAKAGLMSLSWIGRDGKTVLRKLVVTGEGNQFEISPGNGSPAEALTR